MSVNKKRKEERFHVTSDRMNRSTYNMTLCGMLMYGLAANLIICIKYENIYMISQIGSTKFFVGYLICMIAGCIMSSVAVTPLGNFAGYNLVVLPSGFVLSTVVHDYGGIESEVVIQAFLVALCVSICMMIFAVLNPKSCRNLGWILLPVLIGLILAELVISLTDMKVISTSWIGAIVFSLYLAYDVWRSQVYPATLSNAIKCAMDLYLDIINLFLEILELLGWYEESK